MATISSIFKIQDNATKTFNKVANSIDDIISKADQLSNRTSTTGAGIESMNPALTKAIQKYDELNAQSNSLEQKSILLQKQEKLLIRELNKQKNSREQNEKAILGIENRLFNVRGQLEQIENKGNKITQEIEEQAKLINNIANNVGNVKPPQDRIKEGFEAWQAKIITINQGLQLMKSIGNGIRSVLNYSDNLTLSSARLNMVNDGLQTTAELQEKIFAASQRSRGSYDDLAKSVSKLGLTASHAFNSNDEMIAFSEMMQKSFKVSGASQTEISSATYQLTQAMAAGKLQGDEFRSIMENAPMLADAIAKYLGKSKAELKELSREGKITSDIIKAAMFSAAEDINAQYEQMPRTFQDMAQSIKNTAQLEFQGVANKISDMLNNEKVVAFMSKIEKAIKVVAKGAEWMVDQIGKAVSWVYDNLAYVLTIMTVVAGYMLIGMVPAIMKVVSALFLKAAAWAAAHWQILAVIGVLTIGYAIFEKTGSILTSLAWVVLLVAGAYAAWHAIQWALNGALYACPIVWIIALVIAVIAAIYLLIQWILKLVDSNDTALGIICGALNVAIAFIYNLFLGLLDLVLGMVSYIINPWISLANFFGNLFNDPIGSIINLFGSLADNVLGIVETIAKAIDKVFGSNLAGSVSKWRKGLDKLTSKAVEKYGNGSYEKLLEETNLSSDTLGLKRMQYGDSWKSGLDFGNNLASKIESFDPNAALNGLLGGEDDADKYGGYDYQSLLDANGNIPVSLEDDKTKKEVDISDEDLKMLKDIATREYMLNYKHVTPNITIEFGDVRETADVNQIKDALSKMMEEELAELYVVEEA
jgi:tape measure domain-containing protein